MEAGKMIRRTAGYAGLANRLAGVLLGRQWIGGRGAVTVGNHMATFRVVRQVLWVVGKRLPIVNHPVVRIALYAACLIGAKRLRRGPVGQGAYPGRNMNNPG
jgi:hypothetical protein